jgi:FkbM family methyltransferase
MMNRSNTLTSALKSAWENSRRWYAIVRDHIEMRRVYRTRPDVVGLHGVTLEFGPWTPPSVRNWVYDRRYEDPEWQVVTKTLRPDDKVLEIGSGMGYLTVVAARIASEVRSFDANPEIVERARATVLRNGCAATVTNALLERSPERQSAPFYIHADFRGSSLVQSDNTVRTVDVPVLDFSEECRGCTYLIVDIEGAEVELLSGELPGVRAICVECHPDEVTARRITDMLGALFEQGFTLDVTASAGQVLYLTRS